jgi:hypothetical protein
MGSQVAPIVMLMLAALVADIAHASGESSSGRLIDALYGHAPDKLFAGASMRRVAAKPAPTTAASVIMTHSATARPQYPLRLPSLPRSARADVAAATDICLRVFFCVVWCPAVRNGGNASKRLCC